MRNNPAITLSLFNTILKNDLLNQVYYIALKVYQSINDNSRKVYLFNENYINLQTSHLAQKMGCFLFSFHFVMLRIVLLS